ncbi:MAG: hypothetical protein K6T68_06820, partial [Alicyclobacillus shizuokensis]|nr:hypothetical protein [Alicyclobacillus shizuokensis]
SLRYSDVSTSVNRKFFHVLQEAKGFQRPLHMFDHRSKYLLSFERHPSGSSNGRQKRMSQAYQPIFRAISWL